jgi:hypothetical protein
MTSLHDRLADLAESATDGATPEGDDLWGRGRRYARRRRLETLTLTLVLLAAVGSLVGGLLPAATYDVGPADAGAGLRLPDRIERPSTWLKGTDDVGPIGPVVAVFTSTRASGLVPRNDMGLVAVSASGDYAFLDLPGVARTPSLQSGGVALSADGRWIAYPLTGDTRQGPNLTEGDVVTGVGAYDTVTGEARRLELPSDHGITLNDLRWVGDEVRFSSGEYDEAAGAEDDGYATRIADFSWDVTATPSGAERTRRDAGEWYETGTTVDGRVVEADRRRVRVLPGDTGAPPIELRLDVLPEPGISLSPSSVRLALLQDDDGGNRSDGATQPLRFAVVPESGSGDVETIPVEGVKAHELRGWRDDQHVVVQDLAAPGLTAVDVNTGATEPLVRLPSRDPLAEVLVAQGALAAPTFAAPGPPYVMAPWLQAGLIGLGLLLSLAGLRLWRRRDRV